MDPVRNLRSDEIPLAAKMIATAYEDDPSVAALIESVDKSGRVEILEKYFAQLLRLGKKFGRVIAMDHDGALGGLAIFYPPGTYPPKGFSYWINSIITVMVLWPKVGLKRLARLQNISTALTVAQPLKPHYYLELGCVAKNLHNSGIGTRLSSHLFSLSDRDNIGVYAETSNKQNLQILKKIGYATANRRQIYGINFWSLWRKPKTALRSF